MIFSAWKAKDSQKNLRTIFLKTESAFIESDFYELTLFMSLIFFKLKNLNLQPCVQKLVTFCVLNPPLSPSRRKCDLIRDQAENTGPNQNLFHPVAKR